VNWRRWCYETRYGRYRIVFGREGKLFLQYWRGNIRGRRKRKDRGKV